MQATLISTIILATLLTACGSGKSVSPLFPDRVDIAEVDSIQMIRKGYDEGADTVRLLTTTGTKDFLNNWNSCYKSGPCKFLPRYPLIVYRGNTAPKRFRATQESIKDESSDWCANFPDSSCFDKLWASNSVSY